MLLMNKKVAWGLAGFGLLVAAFVGGRYSRPAEVKEKVVEKIVEVKTTETVKRAEESTATAASTAVDKGVTRTVRYRKDGTVASVKEEKRDTVATGTSTTTTKKAEEVKKEIIWKERERVVERLVIAAKDSDWLVSVGAGTSVTGWLGHKPGGLVLPYNGVISASVDRRVFRSFYVGAWGDTTGTVGVRAAVGF